MDATDSETRPAADAVSLLLNPSWLTAKLAATANTAALIADYDRYAVNEPQKLIGRTRRADRGNLLARPAPAYTTAIGSADDECNRRRHRFPQCRA
jgi:hypothetical protein